MQKGKPYSQDLRERVIAAYQTGESYDAGSSREVHGKLYVGKRASTEAKKDRKYCRQAALRRSEAQTDGRTLSNFRRNYRRAK